ncbi:MAG: VOC family protein [Pirellulaceae bacterium]
MRYAHTNIVSENWKKLADFYVRAFECRVVPPIRKQAGDWLQSGTGLPNAELEGAHLLLPGHGPRGPTLEIYQYSELMDQETLPPNASGFRHIAFEVDSVRDALNNVLENGGTAQGDIVCRSVPGVGELTFVYARDPDGNLIELQSWK